MLPGSAQVADIGMSVYIQCMRALIRCSYLLILNLNVSHLMSELALPSYDKIMDKVSQDKYNFTQAYPSF